MSAGAKDAVVLREEILRLGPWHLDVQVTPEISTSVSLEAPAGAYPESLGPVAFLSPAESFRKLLLRIYPGGLDGRSVLDCACNCGGYSFWAKELGAGRCLGSDVRQHWIDQANFLLANRTERGDGIRFGAYDLYDLPKLNLEPFDITIFKGIFYHLPDPVAGLRIAADLTKELILVNTATRNGLPDGMLALDEESPKPLMSGVYGLNWFPTGPDVVIRILRWLGFPEARCFWQTNTTPGQPPELGRLEVIAARKEGFFQHFDRAQAPRNPGCHGATVHDWIFGWAWASDHPEVVQQVDVYDGNTLLGTVAADKFRQDLLDAGTGTGKYGFAFRVPVSLQDGTPHTIRVCLHGTDIDLVDTPKTCTFKKIEPLP
jgi:tRNA (mo5U34)-methyltransferase